MWNQPNLDLLTNWIFIQSAIHTLPDGDNWGNLLHHLYVTYKSYKRYFNMHASDWELNSSLIAKTEANRDFMASYGWNLVSTGYLIKSYLSKPCDKNNFIMIIHHTVALLMGPSHIGDQRFHDFYQLITTMELSSIVLSLIEIKFGANHRAPTFAKLIFFLTFIASRLYLYGFNIYPRLLTLYSK